MNQGQEQFLNFILDRVKADKKEEAETILTECFQRQTAGTFDANFLAEISPKIIETLKEDKKDEVMGIMTKFGASHVSK